MKPTNDWNPELYLQFDRERTRPSLDLVARVPLPAPGRILDVGCGPGNSVPGFLARWPRAQIVGVDTSQAMVEKAQKAYPDHTWRVGDARHLGSEVQADLVFSNAMIQWVPDHERLLPGLLERVAPGGYLAVQVPNYGQMPVSALVDRIFPAFDSSRSGLGYQKIFTVHPAEFYAAVLAPLCQSFEVWETTYFHRLPSARSIVTMLESTGLKPYLDLLEGSPERERFLEVLRAEARILYPEGVDGSVLFPFRRLFFLAGVAP